MSKSIGILTGGGDAPGLNAVIRAVVKYASGVKGWKCYGIEESFNGLMFEDKEIGRWPPKTVRAFDPRRNGLGHNQPRQSLCRGGSWTLRELIWPRISSKRLA